MEFKQYKLQDIATFSQGKQVNIAEQFSHKLDGFKRFIRIVDYTNSSEPERYVENYGDRYYAREDDLVMIRYGSQTAGMVVMGKAGVIANNMFKINLDNDIVLNRYLYYYLSQKVIFENIRSSQSSSTMPAINFSMLNNYVVKIPSLINQKKSVKILDGINRKIELNNQINNNLYNISQALFKKWFIDFEFPNSEGKEYKTHNGKFYNSDIGEIPIGWKINRLDEVADCQNGNAFYKDGYDENGIMVVDLGNVDINGSFIYTNADKYISEKRLQENLKYDKYLLKKDDLVMVMTDRKATMDLLGKTGKIYEDRQYLLNQRMYRIRSKINVNYLYTYLNNDRTLNQLKSKALGSVQKYVNTGHINELKLVIGTDEVMQKFSSIVNPIFERIENNILENGNLQKLRNILLPKLMNGEIDLENIEI